MEAVRAGGPQRFGRAGIGSGYLCPPIFAAPYLPAAVLALQAGGLPLMFGMTIFAGFVEITVSRLFRPLRPFFPPEIAGFVVVMIGVTIGILGFRSMFASSAISGPVSYGVGAVTLGTMVALNASLRSFALPGIMRKLPRLPALTALRAFEAAARLGSVTAAAANV